MNIILYFLNASKLSKTEIIPAVSLNPDELQLSFFEHTSQLSILVMLKLLMVVFKLLFLQTSAAPHPRIKSFLLPVHKSLD